MCYHITGAVKGIGLGALNAALRAAGGGMVFADASASPVQGQLAAGAAGFGLVLHWYSGAVADERFHLGRAAFPLAALDPELLAHMPHDTLYWFTTRP
jgi:hypothetical protein